MKKFIKLVVSTISLLLLLATCNSLSEACKNGLTQANTSLESDGKSLYCGIDVQTEAFRFVDFSVFKLLDEFIHEKREMEVLPPENNIYILIYSFRNTKNLGSTTEISFDKKYYPISHFSSELGIVKSYADKFAIFNLKDELIRYRILLYKIGMDYHEGVTLKDSINAFDESPMCNEIVYCTSNVDANIHSPQIVNQTHPY